MLLKNPALQKITAKITRLLWALPVILSLQAPAASGQAVINLSGQWRFHADPENQGIKEKWFSRPLSDTLHLPGSMQEQGYGNEVTAQTDWYSGKLSGIWQTGALYAKYRRPGQVKIFEWLQPEKHYIGPAWYQRDIQIPAGWKNRHTILFLERVHWSSNVWIDDHLVGARRSLATAHEYDLTPYLRPGSTQRLTIRVDNSQQVNVGSIPHSVSDETQTAWNGIIGRIELRNTPLLRIGEIQVYPDIHKRLAKIRIPVVNGLKADGRVLLRLQAHAFNAPQTGKIKPLHLKIRLNGTDSVYVINYPMGKHVQLWSEFNPALYRLEATLQGEFSRRVMKDTATAIFGMREIGSQGTRFSLNGRPVAIRGNVDCAIFPLHGYPRMDTAWWRKLWRLYKQWGLNAARFHSWCPPEAAFTAADMEGIYLEPEVDEWCNFTTAAQDSFFREESARMLEKYGNHPSFVMMALGNERRADSALLYDLVDTWQKQDDRRVYSGKISGSPLLGNFQFYNIGSFRGESLRYHSGPAPSWPPQPMSTYFNALSPQTTLDYRKAVQQYDKPLVAHEIGQRCSYPDVIHEPAEYTGTLKATYMDIARDQLRERGMLDQVSDFVKASGAWQVALYKEEIEANLRTPGIGGFNLLDLQDFPGQSSAPVGLLNVFYENKGAVTPAQFKRFCSATVLLARMPKRVLENDETFKAALSLYNFAATPLRAGSIVCEIKDAQGHAVYSKTLSRRLFPIGNTPGIGTVSMDLQDLKAPARYNLSVSIPGTDIANDWNFWVYPKHTDTVDASSIMIAHAFDRETEQALASGKTVLLLPDSASIRGGLPICFTGFYWTAFDLHGGESSGGGLLCDPSHPVFNYFPTAGHTSWQWWDLLTRARPMILDDFEDPAPWPKAYRPLVQIIPSWKVNRKLGILVEGKIGKGRLVICSADLEHDLDKRPATRQFRYSLLKYMTSPDFNPTTRLRPEMVRRLFYNYADTTVTIDGRQGGFRFDGIGAISAGASSRLLYDYPEPERSQILDYLFKPGYGASMQLLKVEIGGDMNSTDGSEASHERNPGAVNCNRGYEWWLIKEAKARNPNIKLIGLAWGAPGWVGKFWSKATIDYIKDWLDCARSKGITIDYVGGWNERGWDANWYIALDKALQEHYPDIKIIAADDIHDPWSVATEMTHNAALKRAVDIVGAHSSCGWRTGYTACASTPDARSLGKPLWNSEHSSMSHDVGAVPLARAMNRLYIQGRITGNMCWSLVSAWYASLPIADTGPLLAEWPWSGYYEVGKSIWVYAHTAQFTQPGWRYIDSACGFLDSGASYVTLRSDNTNDYTIVIEAADAKAPQTVTFRAGNGLSGARLQLWATDLHSGDPRDHFVHIRDMDPQEGRFTLTVQPGYLYTLSTIEGHKGTAQPAADREQQMPLPFREDFEGYGRGKPARYFSDINGAFETAPCGGGRAGTSYRQVVSRLPVSWTHEGMRPATLFGDPRWWGGYRVSADVLPEQPGYIELLGRVSAQRGARIAGYHLQVTDNGHWQLYSQDLIKSDTILLSGQVPFKTGEWHRLSLEMQGKSIRVFIDNKEAGRVENTAHTTGQAGLLVSAWQNAQFDNISITKAGEWPRFVPQKNIHITATSEHAANYRGYDYTAVNATDDRPETVWHSEWDPKAPLPQSVTLDLGHGYPVQGLSYQPRLDGNDKGMITRYRIHASEDGIHFKQVTDGAWPATSGTKIVRWPSVTARYIRLTAEAGMGGVASAGAIRVMLARDPAAPGQRE